MNKKGFFTAFLLLCAAGMPMVSALDADLVTTAEISDVSKEKLPIIDDMDDSTAPVVNSNGGSGSSSPDRVFTSLGCYFPNAGECVVEFEQENTFKPKHWYAFGY